MSEAGGGDPQTAPPRVVVVGGGFGGLNVVLGLRDAPVRVLLLDRANHHLFQPLLYQVATGGLAPEDISRPIRSIVAGHANVEVLMADVTDVDRAARTVESSAGSFRWDHLVVATGNRPHYFGNEDWRERAPGLKTVEDALEIRSRVIRAFEEAEKASDPEVRDRLLTFVVVGGGPTGVEMAGALADLARQTLRRDFRRIDPTSARVVLVEGTEHVLPPFPADLRDRAAEDLRDLGVEVRLDELVTDIEEGRVTLRSGETIEAETVVWAAGNRASPLARALDAELDPAGRVVVEPDLTIPGDPRVHVIGDLARFEHGLEGPLPAMAPVAIQMGRHVAANITREVTAAGPRRRFRYRDKGMLATVGWSRAVASIGHLEFTGFVAWILWGIVHIFYLIGFENRAVVMTRWLHAWLTVGRSARVLHEVERATEDAETAGAREG